MLKRLGHFWSLRHAARQYLLTYGFKQTLLATWKYVFVHRSVASLQGKSPTILEGVEAIWVSTDSNSASRVYRVDNHVLAANLAGIHSVHMHANEISTLKALPRTVSHVIFWRTDILIDDLEIFKNPESRARVTVIYDTDDLTFSSEHYTLENVAGLREISATHADHLMNKVGNLQKRQIQDSDFFLGSTQKLADEAEKLSVNSDVVRNTLPVWMFDASKTINRAKQSGVLSLVYASGSNTHRADFLEAWPAISQFLAENRDTTLTILGHSPIQRSEVEKSLRQRVFIKAPVAHEVLLEELAKYDVNLAPLEIGNPFVEAKSALKYLHAGIVGVPTIASSTYEFRLCINHGVNGFVASDKEQWLEALYELRSRDRRGEVGREAEMDISKNHSPERAVSSIREMLVATAPSPPILASLSKGNRAIKKIVWVIPDLPSGSGGHRNVLRFAKFLPTEIYDCTVLVLDSAASDKSLSLLVANSYGMEGIDVTSDRSCVDDADGVFATHHSTTDFVNSFTGESSTKYYLVQDFEAYFYPMGENFVHALGSLFDEKFKIICSGPWMSSKIQEITGRSTPHFNFPVDKAIYNEDALDSERQRRGVIFFAKNDTPRRLYNLGIAALEKVSNARPDLEISLFGGGSIDHPGANSRFNILGKLPSLSDLATLYRKSAVGVVFSTTNPSLVPYEMLACGLPVVDVEVPGDSFNPFGVDSAVLRSLPASDQLAMAILKLLADEDLKSSYVAKGRKLIDSMPSELEAAKIMGDFLAEGP